MIKLQVTLLILFCSWAAGTSQSITGSVMIYEGDSISSVEDYYTDWHGVAWILFTKPFNQGVSELCLAGVHPKGYLAARPIALYTASTGGENTLSVFKSDLAGSFSNGDLVVSLNLGQRGQHALKRFQNVLLKIGTSDQGLEILTEKTFEYPFWYGYKLSSLLISQDDHLFTSMKFLDNPFTTTLIEFNKLDKEFQPLWGETGYEMTSGDQLLVNGYAIPSPDGGCTILFKDDVTQDGSADRNYYLRRLDDSGRGLWNRDVLVNIQRELNGWDFPLFAGDAGDLFILANGSNVARYLPDGTNAYPAFNPPALSINDSVVTYVAIRRTMGNGMIYAECMKRQKDQFPGTDSLIFGQLFDRSGERLWGDNGVAVDRGSIYNTMNFRNSGDTLIRFHQTQDLKTKPGSRLYYLHTQAFDRSGILIWSKDLGPYPNPVTVADFKNGQAVIFFKESPDDGRQRLVATAIQSDGTLGFSSTSVNNEPFNEHPKVRIVQDSRNLIIKEYGRYEFYNLQDLQGRIISHGRIKKSIPTNSLTPGIYILTLFTQHTQPFTTKLFLN
jgi:hypothetical protein